MNIYDFLPNNERKSPRKQIGESPIFELGKLSSPYLKKGAPSKRHTRTKKSSLLFSEKRLITLKRAAYIRPYLQITGQALYKLNSLTTQEFWAETVIDLPGFYFEV